MTERTRASGRLQKKICGYAGIALVYTSGITGAHHAGCSKRPSSKAAASEEARHTLRYVEPLSETKTPYGKRRAPARRGRAGENNDFFSILLEEEDIWRS